MGSSSYIANRREARRFRTQHLAKIVLGPDSMISCKIEDISAGGAKILLEQHTHLPDSFDLFIAAHDLQVHRVRMCWRRHDTLGVSFTRSSEQLEKADALPHLSGPQRNSFQDEYEMVRVELERDEGMDSRAQNLRGVA